jgi:DNA replication protein DnaC
MIAEKKQELSKNMPASKQKNIDKRLRYYTEQEAIERIYQILLNNARIPREYINCSFSNFDYSFIPENETRVKALKEFALNYDKYFRKSNSAQSVLLYSRNNGVGKTHIAVAMAKLLLYEIAKDIFNSNPFEYKRRGVILDKIKYKTPVFFMSEKKYIWCRKRYTSKNEDIINYVEACEKAFLDAEFIIYDDLFRARDTDFYFDELEGIIDIRYDSQKPMIFTTNVNIKTIDQMDPEINPFAGKVIHGAYLLSRIEKMTRGYQFEFADYKDYRKVGVY